MSDLTKCIWKCGNFRFRYKSCNYSSRPAYYFYCSQDLKYGNSCSGKVDRQLILRPEFQASFSDFSEDNGEVSAFEFDSDETETVEDSEDAYLIAEDDDDDESEAINLANTKAMMLEAIELCEQQNALGNTKFVRHFCMKNASNQTLVEEIRHINNQHTMPKTWGPYKHPSSMYHIPVAK
ncbi:hypothetical protein K3495_g2836 [Podosphaera aphanis]|nr:hypothetical protein K3495_g2836 [Podosphaera aphanis]